MSMTIQEYQRKAAETDETGKEMVSLHGVVGEVGSIFAVYKKKERENLPADQFKKQLAEEIGDTLWYLANLATLNDLNLSDIASANITKSHNLFDDGPEEFYDSVAPESQQLPRKAEFEFRIDEDGRTMRLFFEGKQLGNPITDNSPTEDFYRFHDVFHIAYAAVLGWSPNLRKFLGRKRKYDPLIDENEDGARACILEESIAAISFEFARDSGGFREINSIPFSLLSTITRLVKNYEVGHSTRKQWQQAIFLGFRVHRLLVQHNGGRVKMDMDQRRIEFVPMC